MPIETIKEGYITDYISGLSVRETPEEVDAVQPFSKILVDDYGYPKGFVHTRPQYRVKARPSDRKKEYPVDIAVFSSAVHDENQSILSSSVRKRIVQMAVISWKTICAFLMPVSAFGSTGKNACTYTR